MSEIKKNKNTVEFWVDGKAKPYVFCIDTAVMLGLRGGALQRVPNDVMKMCHSRSSGVVTLIDSGYVDKQYIEWFQLADKLDAIGYTASVREIDYWVCNCKKVPFKRLAEYLRNGGTSLLDFAKDMAKVSFLEQNGLRIDEHFTEPMADFLFNRFCGEDKNTISVIAYWLSRGAWEYHHDESYNLRSRLLNIIAYYKDLGWELEKGDFYRQYINASRAHTAKKDEIANRKMREYQEYRRKALTFEDDNFVVIIPTTVDELRDEGHKQSNCVGGYARYIGEKDRNVVFIRHKANPTKPYITCDITRSGSINQFLVACNCYTHKIEDIAFREAYQKHLKENWGK